MVKRGPRNIKIGRVANFEMGNSIMAFIFQMAKSLLIIHIRRHVVILVSNEVTET